MALRRSLVLAFALQFSACATPVAPGAKSVAAPALDRGERAKQVAAVLDDLHDAAAHADETRYFAHYADDAVFLGTDATERWDVAAFRAYAHPRFSEGHGWIFHSTRRAISLSQDGTEAWFDEDLTGEKLGPARGSGVLRFVEGRYRVVQYNLALTIPNERFDAVHALLDPAASRTAAKRAYDEAVGAAAAGDVARSRKLLLDLVPAAKTRPGDDSEFWLHNQLTWVEWADGRLEDAVREADASKIAVLHGVLPAAEQTTLLLHHYWDRAYLLREIALAAHDGDKALLQASLAAKADYDGYARAAHDDDGMNVLTTFFAVRRGDAKAAVDAAKRVDDSKDGDLQDLYVLALAYDLAKDSSKAAALRTRICGAKTYLMKPLIARALAKEGHACP
ncbi:hypothetical protein BH09MYX1_BH09MYX1_22120 [soil metagenome]